MKKLLLLIIALVAFTIEAQIKNIVEDGVNYTILVDEGYAVASAPRDAAQCPSEDIVIKESVADNGISYPVTHFWGYEYIKDGQKICLPNGLKEIRGYSAGAVIEQIPEGLESVLEGAFYGVTVPTEMYLPNIKVVGPNAFTGSGIKKIHFGASLNMIGTYPFDKDITDVTFDDGDNEDPLVIGTWSLSTLPLKEIKFPKRKNLKISDCAVSSNDDVERIVFPDLPKIEYSGTDTYSNISCIFELYGCFFRNCKNLKEVVCMSATPTEITNLDVINSYPSTKATEFNICNNVAECVLKVPAGSEALYAAHPIWGKFKTIYGFENGDYTSINGIETEDNQDSNSTYYNLQGLKINSPAAGEVYIRVRGNKAEKVVLSHLQE